MLLPDTFSLPETRDGIEVALVEPDLLLVHRLLPVERRRDRLRAGPGDPARRLPQLGHLAEAGGVGGGVEGELRGAVVGEVLFGSIETVHLGVQVAGQLKQTRSLVQGGSVAKFP